MKLGKLGKGQSSPTDKKQSPVLIVLVIVIILGAGFFVARNFMGSGSNASSPDQSASTPPMGPSASAPGQNPPGAPSTPNAAPASPSAKPGAPAKAAATPNAQPKPAAKKPEPKKIKMTNMKVFGTVSVNYPESWKISPNAANNAAIFTDGKAVLEVIPPDMKATSAKAIATSALKSVASKGSIAAQGKDKVANSDAYWYAVKSGGKTIRIVGIDGSTRVVLVEQAPSAAFATYRNVFNQIQSQITFSK